MQPEIKNCQNCKQNFTIEPEDFNFYEKIKVPPPTFCPECRLIRRMAWRNERALFKRPCAKTGKEIITMFHPEANVVVYDRDVWWSDQWEPTDYGMDYDFSNSSLPFFEQFKELLSKVPLANLGNENCVGSPYGNHNADCKDCYLTYASFNNERTHYSYGVVGVKDSMDMYVCSQSQLSYNDIFSEGVYKTHFSYDADECLDSFFLKYCKNCNNCIGCMNLRNRTNSILNVQYTKEEYEKKKAELDFGSYKILSEFAQTFKKFTLDFPYRYTHIMRSQDCTGDNIINSKNAKECFDLYGKTEDSKYVIHFVDGRDCYDLYGGGAVASMMYEGVDVGIQTSDVNFAVLTHSCFETNYTYMCFGSKNLFGCIGMRNKQYCILNKQYTKEKYFELVEKIKLQMKVVPYLDKRGNKYEYGEFFPSEISPFAYNETIAQEYFPKNKEEILSKGDLYRESVEKDYQATIRSEDLPDHIKDAPESIIEEIISCPNDGSVLTQCTKAYRITKTELEFLRNNNIALPRYCPNCRHYKRLKKRNPMKLWDRVCMKEGCGNKVQTSYSPDRPEIIYCEKCYQAEVY